MQTWIEYIRDHDFESDADRSEFITACVDYFQVPYTCVVNAIGGKLNADSSYQAEHAMERRVGA